jgi:hypothetical protein
MASFRLTPAEREILLFHLPEDSAAHAIVTNARMVTNAINSSPFAYVVECEPIDARYLQKVAKQQCRQAEWDMILTVELARRREPRKPRSRRGRSTPLPSSRQLSFSFD